MARIGRWILIILGAIVIAVAAYYIYRNFFGGKATEPQVSLGNPAILDCNAECAKYGQCGVRMHDEIPVVLAGKDEIKVEQQDLYFFDTIEIMVTAENKAVVSVSTIDTGDPTGEDVEVQFWKVKASGATPETAKEGWVAEWCVIPKVDTDTNE